LRTKSQSKVSFMILQILFSAQWSLVNHLFKVGVKSSN
jgi:hypothetical protein